MYPRPLLLLLLLALPASAKNDLMAFAQACAISDALQNVPSRREWTASTIRGLNDMEPVMIGLTSAYEISHKMGVAKGLKGKELEDYAQKGIARGYDFFQEAEKNSLARGHEVGRFKQATADQFLKWDPALTYDQVKNLRDALYYQHSILDTIGAVERRVEREFPVGEPDVTSTSPRKIFGLGKTFTKEQLKNQYFKLMKVWHPDRNPDKVNEAKKMSQKIGAAFERLTGELDGTRIPEDTDDVLYSKRAGDDLENIPQAIDKPTSFGAARNLPQVSQERIDALLSNPNLPPAIRETIVRYQDARRAGRQPHNVYFAAFVGHLEGYLNADAPSTALARPAAQYPEAGPDMLKELKKMFLADPPPKDLWEHYFPNEPYPQTRP